METLYFCNFLVNLKPVRNETLKRSLLAWTITCTITYFLHMTPALRPKVATVQFFFLFYFSLIEVKFTL